MNITLKQLAVFVAVAKSENVSRAAEIMHLTQSACSMALSALENQLAGPLFDRHGKRLILNERGKRLWPKAVNLIAQVEEIQALMTQEKGKALTGQLLIGASSTIGNYLLPEIIGDFLMHHPKAKITLSVANTEQVIQKLQHFEIDIGLIEGRCHAAEISVIPWKKDELVIVAAPNYPLVKKTKITQQDLQTAQWILREPGSGTRNRFEEAMEYPVIPFLELGHTEAVKQAVQKGLGISCLSKLTVIDALKTGKLVALKTPLKLTRDFFILLHQQKYQTILLTQFMKTCQK